MKQYDAILVGTGSGLNLAQYVLQSDPNIQLAVIDKDPPGGICLTKGCIPTKLLVYPADLVRALDRYRRLGIDVALQKIDFAAIMKRMRATIEPEIDRIAESLRQLDNIDYFSDTAAFIEPHVIQVGRKRIGAETIFLCLGSRPRIPTIEKLDQVDYYTSDTILALEKRPEHIAVVGGGYIAAEYGHFFSAMGSRVTLIGSRRRLLPEEEPEISELARKQLSRHMHIITGHRVRAVEPVDDGKTRLIAENLDRRSTQTVVADAVLIAAGRQSNADLVQPGNAGIETDSAGWVRVDPYLETTRPGHWAFGDATGRHMFKHVANYEARIVFFNAFLGERIQTDYSAIPHAVFTHPQIAAVGMKEREAVERLGAERVRIGFQEFRETARGEAMAVQEGFVKVIVDDQSERILGAHIIGPEASILIQEVVTLMYTPDADIGPITDGMHIHPALGEVVERAFLNLMPVAQYRQRRKERRDAPG